MSWTTGTQTEGLSVSSSNGSAYSTSTSVAVISAASSAGYLPANFFLPAYGIGKGLLVKAFGVLSTASTPNLTLAVVADGTLGSPPANLTSGTTGVVATTGTLAQGSAVSNVPWEAEVLLSCSATGSSGTILAEGMWKIYNSATTINTARISSSTANPNTAATLSTLTAYYIELAALWGTNSASNTITCYGYTVLGLN